MKRAVIFTHLFIFFSINFALGQNVLLSKHEFSFYKNDVQDSFVNAKISVIVSGDTIKSNKIGNFYYFPILDTSNNFDIEIKIDDLLFIGHEFRPWMLNQGSNLILGKITNFDKLLSVAAYNEMTKKDEDWKLNSNRFFIIGHAYTLDIENRDKINELQFLIMSPNNSNRYVITQKVIK